MAVSFFFKGTRVTLTERKRLKAFISKIFKSHGKELGSLNYIFCTDRYLLDINRKFLKHDYYTDIITFDLSVSPQITVGEIYISLDRVRDNAGKIDVSVRKELHRVMFHGALHLCGYTDKTPKGKKIMTLAEDKNLRLYLS